jgi:hypothetical protein
MLGVGRAGAWRRAEPSAIGGGGLSADPRAAAGTARETAAAAVAERDACVILNGADGVARSRSRLLAAFGSAGVLRRHRTRAGRACSVAASVGRTARRPLARRLGDRRRRNIRTASSSQSAGRA